MAVLLTVSVSTLSPVVGFGLNAAVTPLGRPDAARVTLPVIPFWGVTSSVDVPEAPWITVSEAGEALRVKLGGGAGLTVSSSVVVVVSLPAVPMMVTGKLLKVGAVLLAVSVSTLAPVVGFGVNEAVTPTGRGDAVRLTLPVNPFRPVTVIADVPEPLPWKRLREAGEAPREKLWGRVVTEG